MKLRETVTFGSADGLTAAIGIVLATAARGDASVIHAMLGLLVAEGVGMGAFDFLSHEKTAAALREGTVMALATSVPIILVALPWLMVARTTGVLASAGVAVVLAGMVAWGRAGAWTRWPITYGVLAGVAGLAWLVGALWR